MKKVTRFTKVYFIEKKYPDAPDDINQFKISEGAYVNTIPWGDESPLAYVILPSENDQTIIIERPYVFFYRNEAEKKLEELDAQVYQNIVAETVARLNKKK